MAKKKSKADSSAESDTPCFEEALQQLQQIVTALEDGSLGLEASMQQFERGVALLRVCHTALEQAEHQIEVLTGFDAAGNPTTTPFDASSSTEADTPKAGRRNRSSGHSNAASEDSATGSNTGTLFS